jgi:hypothetical protein
MQERQGAQACLAVIAARVLNNQRGIPFELPRKLKGQAAFGNVPFVLGGVEREAHY